MPDFVISIVCLLPRFFQWKRTLISPPGTRIEILAGRQMPQTDGLSGRPKTKMNGRPWTKNFAARISLVGSRHRFDQYAIGVINLSLLKIEI